MRAKAVIGTYGHRRKIQISQKIVDEIVQHSNDLRRCEIIILLHIAAECSKNGDGQVRQSYTEISRLTRIPKSSVWKSVMSLDDKGLIKILDPE